MAMYAVDLVFTDGSGEVHHSLYKKIEDFLNPKPINYACPELAEPRVDPDDDARYISATIETWPTTFWRRYSSIDELKTMCSKIMTNKHNRRKEAALKNRPGSAILE